MRNWSRWNTLQQAVTGFTWGLPNSAEADTILADEWRRAFREVVENVVADGAEGWGGHFDDAPPEVRNLQLVRIHPLFFDNPALLLEMWSAAEALGGTDLEILRTWLALAEAGPGLETPTMA